MDAVLIAARQIAAGQADLMIAGGVESMSRAPFVMPKADAAFSREAQVFDTTIGWRFVNPAMQAAHGTDSMPQTGQNVADDSASAARRRMPWRWRARPRRRGAGERAAGARDRAGEPPQKKGDPVVVDRDEHPRATTAEALGKLRPLFPNGSVTAGNASGVNDGAAALILASGRRHGRRG